MSLARAYLLLCLVALFWSGNALVGKAVVGVVPPIALAFWRWTLACILFAPFAWRELIQVLPVLRAQWRWMVPLSILSVGAFNTLLYISLQYTTALNVSVLNAALPISITLAAWLIYRTPVGLAAGAGIVLSVIGVLAIITRGDPHALATLTLNRGDLIALAAFFSWALYTVFLPRHRPAGVGGRGFLAGTMIIGWLFIVPFYVWELASGAQFVPQTRAFLGIAYLGIFPSVLAYLFWNAGVTVAGASVAGVFTNLVPVLAAVGAVLFLGETFHGYHAFGIAVVLCGVWLVTRAEWRRRRPAR